MSKYNSRKVIADGYEFDSEWEYEYYSELKILERAGEIQDLVIKPVFLLIPSFKRGKRTIRKTEYIADFQFVENGQTVVVDTKSPPTRKKDSYRLKRKLFLQKYQDGIEFREVCKNGEVHIY